MRGTKAFKHKKKEAKKRVRQGLTAWVASKDISSGFVVQEDEQGVGEGTEPPTWPGGRREREKVGYSWKCERGDKKCSSRAGEEARLMVNTCLEWNRIKFLLPLCGSGATLS